MSFAQEAERFEKRIDDLFEVVQANEKYRQVASEFQLQLISKTEARIKAIENSWSPFAYIELRREVSDLTRRLDSLTTKTGEDLIGLQTQIASVEDRISALAETLADSPDSPPPNDALLSAVDKYREHIGATETTDGRCVVSWEQAERWNKLNGAVNRLLAKIDKRGIGMLCEYDFEPLREALRS